MARQRASQARDAFARVGTAPVPELPADDQAASITASGKDSGNTDQKAGGKDSAAAGRKAGGKAGRGARRVGRPRGPERVPLTIRILTDIDERLTAAVEATGQSPQYIVDAALAAYLDQIGITAGPGAARRG